MFLELAISFLFWYLKTQGTSHPPKGRGRATNSSLEFFFVRWKFLSYFLSELLYRFGAQNRSTLSVKKTIFFLGRYFFLKKIRGKVESD